MGTAACNYQKDPELEIETNIFGPDGQVLVHKKQVLINNTDN
jgi:hypothetical protein